MAPRRMRTRGEGLCRINRAPSILLNIPSGKVGYIFAKGDQNIKATLNMKIAQKSPLNLPKGPFINDVS